MAASAADIGAYLWLNWQWHYMEYTKFAWDKPRPDCDCTVAVAAAAAAEYTWRCIRCCR